MKKECLVIILPTNKPSRLVIQVGGCSSAPLLQYLKKAPSWLGGSFVPRELYIYSTDQIQEGDWIYAEFAGVNLATKKNKINWQFAQKIIATTNSSLQINDNFVCKQLGSINAGKVLHSTKLLPAIPQSFIQKYINSYNSGNKIEKILVEYEEDTDNIIDRDSMSDYPVYGEKPQLHNNEIVIYNKLKTYNKNQLIVDFNSNVLLKAHSHSTGPFISVNDLRDWLQNL